MRLRTCMTTCAVALLATLCAGYAQDTQSGNVDVRHSRATFTVSHLYLAHVTGSVPIVAATVVLGPKSTVPTSVSATLDATRIASGDGDRDSDLQGPDWFDTKQYPTWTFASSSIAAKTDNAFVVAGTLTTHGVAQSMTLDVTATHGFPHPEYHAVGHVDRHGFAMRVTPTDGLIGSDVTVTLDVQLR